MSLVSNCITHFGHTPALCSTRSHKLRSGQEMPILRTYGSTLHVWKSRVAPTRNCWIEMSTKWSTESGSNLELHSRSAKLTHIKFKVAAVQAQTKTSESATTPTVYRLQKFHKPASNMKWQFYSIAAAAYLFSIAAVLQSQKAPSFANRSIGNMHGS